MHNSKPCLKSQFKNAIIKIKIFWDMIHAMCKIGTELHTILSHKTVKLTLAAVWTSNPTVLNYVLLKGTEPYRYFDNQFWYNDK
jgi:hypothetical protein